MICVIDASSHGSTLLAGSAEPSRAARMDRNESEGRAKGPNTSPSRREAVRCERAKRDHQPLVSFDNGKAPARSSRAAWEWYCRSGPQGAFSVCAPLCAAEPGFFSVNAVLTVIVYHRRRKMSRITAENGIGLTISSPSYCLFAAGVV